MAATWHRNPFVWIFGALLLAQVTYWGATQKFRPDLSIVPTPPSEATLHALTFGDSEFYFRFKALQLQNFGDSFGRFTALRYYDYSKLYQWLLLLDTLDSKSNMLPSLATYYFSQTQNRADVRYLIHYLHSHAKRDIAAKWWWLLQSIYLSMHRANDMELALRSAEPMMDDSVPAFAQQMLAVVHEKRGEMQDALRIMETIGENTDKLTENDLRYMRYFIDERIGKLEESSQN